MQELRFEFGRSLAGNSSTQDRKQGIPKPSRHRPSPAKPHSTKCGYGLRPMIPEANATRLVLGDYPGIRSRETKPTMKPNNSNLELTQRQLRQTSAWSGRWPSYRHHKNRSPEPCCRRSGTVSSAPCCYAWVRSASSARPWPRKTTARRFSPQPAIPSSPRSTQPALECPPGSSHTKVARYRPRCATPGQGRLPSPRIASGSCRHPESGSASSLAGNALAPPGRWPGARKNRGQLDRLNRPTVAYGNTKLLPMPSKIKLLPP